MRKKYFDTLPVEENSSSDTQKDLSLLSKEIFLEWNPKLYAPQNYKELLNIINEWLHVGDIINADKYSKFSTISFSDWIEKETILLSKQIIDESSKIEKIEELLKDPSVCYIVLPNWVIIQNYVPLLWWPREMLYEWDVLFSQKAIWAVILDDWSESKAIDSYTDILLPYLASKGIHITNVIGKEKETQSLWIWLSGILKDDNVPLSEMPRNHVETLYVSLKKKIYIIEKSLMKNFSENASIKEMHGEYISILESVEFHMNKHWIEQPDRRIPKEKNKHPVKERIE